MDVMTVMIVQGEQVREEERQRRDEERRDEDRRHHRMMELMILVMIGNAVNRSSHTRTNMNLDERYD